jgi:hypothetical protein
MEEVCGAQLGVDSATNKVIVKTQGLNSLIPMSWWIIDASLSPIQLLR